MSKLSMFLKMNYYEKKKSVVRNTYRLINKKKFKALGNKSYIIDPIFLSGTEYINIGDTVEVWNNARIEIIDKWNNQKFNPELTLGNNVNIGQDLHLTCANNIFIGDNVLCTRGVTITDIIHNTNETNVPVLYQNIDTKPVRIDEGVFIGVNAVILPGVTIGRNAIIGANSVVTRDVPENATVVGAPAQIISVKNND